MSRDGSQDVALIVAVEDYAFLPDVPGARDNAFRASPGTPGATDLAPRLLGGLSTSHASAEREDTRASILGIAGFGDAAFQAKVKTYR